MCVYKAVGTCYAVGCLSVFGFFLYCNCPLRLFPLSDSFEITFTLLNFYVVSLFPLMQAKLIVKIHD